MLVFIILGIIIIGGVALCIWGDFGGYKGKECAQITGGAMIFITGLILCVLLFDVPWKKDVEYDLAKYEVLKAELEQTSGEPLLQKELVPEVTEMNNYIEKNRVYSESIWGGRLFSKTVGNLPKLEINDTN